MNIASGDRIANLVFAACCIVLVAIAVGRYRAPGREVQARESFLKQGTPDPLGLPASDETGPLVCVFISSDCQVCSDSLPFYRRLAEGVGRSPGRAGLIFVSMEAQEDVSAYLRTGGIVSPRVASVGRPPGIPGTPCILLLDRFRRVERSWAGRLSRRQEREIEAMVLAQ